MSEAIATVGAIATLIRVLGGLAWASIMLVRWARKTGRRPWLWLLGAYAALNVMWAVARGMMK